MDHSYVIASPSAFNIVRPSQHEVRLCQHAIWLSEGLTIVLRPGPVQGPGSGFWPGHQVGRVNSFYFLNQNNVVLVKKKSQRVYNRVLLGHTRFFLPLFFLQPGPVPTPGRSGPGSTPRAGFQNYGSNITVNSRVWVLETNCKHLTVETLRVIHKFRAIVLESPYTLFFLLFS